MKNSREKLDRWIIASIGLHVGVVLCLFVAPSLFQAKSDVWGSKAGGNGGVNVRIVSHMSGIALPSPPVTTDEAPSESKALYKSPPEPKTKAPEKTEPDAVKLPSKTAEKKPAPASTKETKTASAAPPTPAPANAVTYGAAGGNPSLRYGQTAPGTGPTGAEFGGDGTFGEKYGYYVDAMTRAITDAWSLANVSKLQSPRVYVTFTIGRNGSVSNVQLEKQTSNPSLVERAARDAVQRAKLQPLPPDYHGGDVSVRFYFDYAP